MNASHLIPIVTGALALSAAAQETLESDYRTMGRQTLAAFEPQRLVIQKSSAVILDGRKEIACGVVISADGDVLTKASELEGVKALSVAIDTIKYPEVRVMAVDPVWDVAHLKVAASGLTPVVYAPTSELPQGTWVVANGASTRTQRRILAGVLSANAREVPATGGTVLGVVLKQPAGKKDPQLVIESVADGGGAKEADLRPGDLITEVEGRPVKTRDELAAVFKKFKAGDSIKVTVRRGKEVVTAVVRLVTGDQIAPEEMRSRNDAMSGEFSLRRSGFPRVLQHDILGARHSNIGGPLLDLDGRCVGMNIARANRAESFAIPVEELKALAGRMLKQAAKTAPAP